MDLFEVLPLVALSLGEVALVCAIVFFINRRIAKSYADRPDQQFRRQSILVATVLTALLTIILILPVPNETRGALLSLFGIVLSATIALSSTNLVGNIMAGIMLRSVGSFRLGDYIRVGEYFGRVSEMDLLHLEIQTEERDLTTIPNTYVAANPVRVMRTSGSILSVELSLGYDVSRHEIEKLLLEAASRCDLESP
ncbi:MAG: mechanosensitive ion channel domain-containing protein, partial [Pseudomonadota bacterium]